MAEHNYWSQRVSRRTALRGAGLGVAGLAGAALIGCGGDDDDAAPAATAAATQASGSVAAPAAGGMIDTPFSLAQIEDAPVAKRGGTFRASSRSDVLPTKDVITTQGGARGTGAAVYSMMVQKKGTENKSDHPSLEISPDLGQSWEVTPDGLQYTFDIVKNAHITPPIDRQLTTEDIVFSWDRWKALAVNPDQLDMIESMTAPDDFTLVMKLNRPEGIFLNRLTDNFNFMVYPKEADGGYDPEKEMIGSGPWMLKEYTPSLVLRMERSPTWHGGPDRPYLDTYEVNYVPERAQEVNQFLGGNLDGVGSLSAENGLRMIDAGMQWSNWGGTPGIGHIAFGDPRDGSAPWADDRVRKAVSLGLDRDKLYVAAFGIDKLKSAGIDWDIVWAAHVPAAMGKAWVDPKTDDGNVGKFINYDPAEAKKLLAAAGYPDGFKADFNYSIAYGTSWATEAEIIPQMLKDVGIDLTINVNDHSSVYVPKTFKGDFTGLAYILNAWPEPENYLSAFYTPGAGRNQSKVDDPALLKEIRRVNSIFDLSERQGAIQDLLQVLANKMYYVPAIGWSGPSWTAAQPYVKNWGKSKIARGATYVVSYPTWWLDQ